MKVVEIVGTVKVVHPREQVTDKFQKAGLVLQTDEKYPQTLFVEFFNDNIAEMENFSVGDVVSVNVNIRGREWTSPQGETKYFTSLNGWAVNMATASVEHDAGQIPDKEDDLPF